MGMQRLGNPSRSPPYWTRHVVLEPIVTTNCTTTRLENYTIRGSPAAALITNFPLVFLPSQVTTSPLLLPPCPSLSGAAAAAAGAWVRLGGLPVGSAGAPARASPGWGRAYLHLPLAADLDLTRALAASCTRFKKRRELKTPPALQAHRTPSTDACLGLPRVPISAAIPTATKSQLPPLQPPPPASAEPGFPQPLLL